MDQQMVMYTTSKLDSERYMVSLAALPLSLSNWIVKYRDKKTQQKKIKSRKNTGKTVYRVMAGLTTNVVLSCTSAIQ